MYTDPSGHLTVDYNDGEVDDDIQERQARGGQSPMSPSTAATTGGGTYRGGTTKAGLKASNGVTQSGTTNGGCDKVQSSGTSNSATLVSNAQVVYNGTTTSVYRGGSSLKVRAIDVKFNSETGKVSTQRGISVNVDPAKVVQFGGAYRVDYLPEQLQIIQRGSMGHYEIVPVNEMFLEMFQWLLNQIILTGPFY